MAKDNANKFATMLMMAKHVGKSMPKGKGFGGKKQGKGKVPPKKLKSKKGGAY